MNKVTSVNLNGRAYQLEEGAYEALTKYLHQARSKLASDPGKDEVMQDFEQAIAAKCDDLLTTHKNVVSTKEMTHIITAMGSVEPAESDDGSNNQATESSAAQPKRLYILREGEVIGGVCSGIAAYLNVDVTIVRLIFVILAFATSGFWILVYLLLLVILPEARTAEQKAELRGEQFTAQTVLTKAKQKYSEISTEQPWKRMASESAPALSRAGQVVRHILRIVAAAVATMAGILLIFITVAFSFLMAQVIWGDVRLQDQLATMSVASQAGLLVSFYALLSIPTLWIVVAGQRFASKKQSGKQFVRWSIIGSVLWFMAGSLFLAIGTANQQRISEYQRSHGYLIVNERQTICINDELCYGSSLREYHYHRTVY